MIAWAIRWGIPPEALADLHNMLGLERPEGTVTGMSEAAVQNRARLAAAEIGGRMWRNNLGATKDENGNFFRYGLCNDTPALNKKLKSSDLIGIYPFRVEPCHVGHVVGQFWAKECKAGGWGYSASEREVAQLAFGKLVISLGGRFDFDSIGRV